MVILHVGSVGAELSITFDVQQFDLQDLARLIQYFDYLWADLAQLEMQMRQEPDIPERPEVPRPPLRSITSQSPLVFWLLGSAAVSKGALWLVRYWAKDPERFGGAVLDTVTGAVKSRMRLRQAMADNRDQRRILSEPATTDRPDEPPAFGYMVPRSRGSGYTVPGYRGERPRPVSRNPRPEPAQRARLDSDRVLRIARPVEADLRGAGDEPPEWLPLGQA